VCIPGISQAQCSVGEDGPGLKNGTGDPDQPDPSQPPASPNPAIQPHRTSWLDSGIELWSRAGSTAPAPTGVFGRTWLEGVLWVFRLRFGW
jgi:hypothetical protein